MRDQMGNSMMWHIKGMCKGKNKEKVAEEMSLSTRQIQRLEKKIRENTQMSC